MTEIGGEPTAIRRSSLVEMEESTTPLLSEAVGDGGGGKRPPSYNPGGGRAGAGQGTGIIVQEFESKQYNTDSANKVHIGSKALSDKDVPFVRPNCHHTDDIIKLVNGKLQTPANECARGLCMTVCCLTGIGALFLCGKNIVVDQGELGYTLNNGRPIILPPGRHQLLSPFHSYESTIRLREAVIQKGQVSIITIDEGNYGFANNAGIPIVLLPGRHVRNDPLFRFVGTRGIREEQIEIGPLSLITINPGFVGIARKNGVLVKMEQGRYEIYSTTFKFTRLISIQQELKEFSDIVITTRDGVQMRVRGLLTYQVVDVDKLIHEIGAAQIAEKLELIAEASLVNIFARYNLKELQSSPTDLPSGTSQHLRNDEKDDGLLGPQQSTGAEGSSIVRSTICDSAVEEVQDHVKAWGVRIMRFQLKSLLFMDQKFAANYENATLKLATSEADYRAAKITNNVLISKAQAQAEASRLQALGEADAEKSRADASKYSVVRAAEGQAEAVALKAKARNDAAETMSQPFAQQLELLQLQKEIVAANNVASVTLLGDQAPNFLWNPGQIGQNGIK